MMIGKVIASELRCGRARYLNKTMTKRRTLHQAKAKIFECTDGAYVGKAGVLRAI